MIHRPTKLLFVSHSVVLSVALCAGGCNSSREGSREGGPAVQKSNMYGIQPDEPSKSDAPAAPAGPKTTAGPGWDAVRKALFVADNCYGGRLEYCVTDSAFVNPLIQGVLDKWYDGVMPADAEKIDEIIKSSRARYTEALQTADGLRRIEKLVEERFNKPVVTKKDKAVLYDYGYLPTKLSIYRSRIAGGGASEHLDGNQWKSSEVGQAFAKALSENPQAQSITIYVDIPSMSASPRWTYQYEKTPDRVVIWTPSTIQGAYLTGPIGHDFSTVISGKMTLQTGQLKYDRGYSSSR